MTDSLFDKLMQLVTVWNTAPDVPSDVATLDDIIVNHTELARKQCACELLDVLINAESPSQEYADD